MELVPLQYRGKGFYSHYFLTQKKNWGWRPILDLRTLNKFVQSQRFKMVTLGMRIPALECGHWFSALNLQDAYFHVTIHPAHRQFLRFTVGSNYYQYRVLPFGLSTAPKVFSKTLRVVAAHLCRQGTVIFLYLDDCLMKGPTQMAATEITQRALTLFQNLKL